MDLVYYKKILTTVTTKKILNVLKILISYYLSIILKKPIRFGIPFSINIEPTNICNLKCPQCAVGLNLLKRNKGFIEFQMFKDIIDQVAPYILNIQLYFQGEPFLHKDILKMIKYAKTKNIHITISTNGHFISENIAKSIIEAGLDKIIVSLDGTTQEVYEKYRVNGDLNKVIQGIKLLNNMKKKYKSNFPYIEAQFLVLKFNQDQIKEFKQLCKKLNVNLCSLKSAQIIDFSSAEKFIPTIPEFSRYKKVNNQYVLKKKLKNRCWRLWYSAAITWDGYVVPCCYDKDAKYAFGNIKDEPFSKLIKNENFKSFAQRVLTNRKSIDICRNCWD